MKKQMLMSVMILGLMVLFNGRSAHAQDNGTVQADVPFTFYAGDTKFPAGKYTLKVLNDSDLTVIEISSTNGRMSALCQIEEAREENPSTSELVFNKFGDQYFLAKVLESGSSSGSALRESKYERRVEKNGIKAETRSIPTRHTSAQAMKR